MVITSKIGILGENIAETFLVKRGFKILEKNYLKKWGEIDIVAKKGKTIRFVEVKAVSCEMIGDFVSRETPLEARECRNNPFSKAIKASNRGETKLDEFRPEENVHHHKLMRLNRAIQSYLSERHVSPETLYQIDVVAVWVNINTKQARVEFLENVSFN